MFHHSEKLVHKARESEELIAHLTSALIARNYEMAAVDVTKLQANTAEITRIATVAAAGDSAAIQEAVAAQLESDQAAVDNAVAAQSSALAPLTAEFPPTAPPASLTVTPAAVSFTAGTAGTASVSISGGSPPYTAADLPSGITFNGSTFVAEAGNATGNATVVVSDSSTPALTGDVAISIA